MHLKFTLMKQFLFSLLSLLLLCVGCGTIELPDGPSQSGPKHKVIVHTRAADNVVPTYPVEVLAFDAAGQCAARQTLKKAEDALALQLVDGTYRVVAFAGLPSSSVLGDRPALSATALPTGASPLFTQALLRAETSVTVTNKRTQVHLLLAPVVTAAELHLTQLPADVTQVEVELSPACTALNLAGERSGVGAVTVPLVRDAAGTWNSGTRYLLPAGSAPTRLSIRWVRNGEQAVYGYTYPQALTPGTPYRFEGAFVDDAAGGTVGDVSVAAWNAPIVQSFRFGKGSESPNITPQPPGGGGQTGGGTSSTTWEGRVWNGHVVALVQNVVGNEADFVLISRAQWDPVPSAYAETAAQEAAEYAVSYKEGELTDWRIPTREEAVALSAYWRGEKLNTINATLRELHESEIYDKVEGRSVAYICDEARSVFSFVENGRVRKAGKSVSTYLLRLVKTVHVRFVP